MRVGFLISFGALRNARDCFVAQRAGLILVCCGVFILASHRAEVIYHYAYDCIRCESDFKSEVKRRSRFY
jgi:hypothetical protein